MRVAYLKVNRFSEIMISCVNCWVKIFQCAPDAKVFFLCDKPEVRAEIERKIDLS